MKQDVGVRGVIFSLEFAAKNLVPESYWDIQNISNPRVSPSGDDILFSKRYIDKVNDSFVTETWVMNSKGENKRYFTDGSNAKWSPDGTKVAFIKSDKNDNSQIFIKYLASEAKTQVTNFAQDISDFAWSKDGKHFVFASFNEYDDDWQVEIPGEKEGESYNWTEKPKVVTTMHWRADGQGELESGEDHLYLVSSDGGSAAKISDWGMDYQGSLSWYDESTVLFQGNGSLNDMQTPWKQSSVFLLDINSKKLEKISPDNGVFTTPKSSENGKIVFLGHPSTNYSSVAFDVYLSDGKSQARSLTSSLSATPRELFWLSENEVIFSVDDRGALKVLKLNVLSKKISEVIPDFKEQFNLSSVSGNILYGSYANDKRPSEVAVISGSKLDKLTSFNEIVLGQYDLGETVEINYKAPDGTPVQGWYILPPGFDKSKKYPLILIIHGGPHAMYRYQFNYLWHQFASDGYVVLYTNPRGSTGYGSEFANVIDNDYPGMGDLSDLLSGVDYVTNLGFVDESKMYVQGCSGGGVLTAWVVGHDDRFAAAASLCPVTNWISMVGTTDIPAWTFEWFDVPFWEDPTNWLERSPIMRTGYIKTPTLFMTGVLDIRTPMPQTEEMYVALKEAGVDTVLVRMNGEWHGTGRRKPTNWFRTYGYLSEWYQKYQK
ncbi:MAG: S9 family peptidase [Proteobacteria bacterium]|nr:S9 family peptidase [Pseudomonadota bacterium]